MPASALPFTKMQAVGNDFVVVEEAVWPPDTTDWSRAAVPLCDRKFGVGGDGLLVLAASQSADLRMLMFNADGTEDMCGNGLRCLIHLAFEKNLIERTGCIETIAGNRAFTVHPDGTITTDMGVPKFTAEELPVDTSVFRPRQRTAPRVENVPVQAKGTAFWLSGVVNTGSTHAVVFVNELPDDEEFLFWSPRVEEDSLFPERTSLMWAKVEGGNRLRLRIWERGVGETLGCGTGACAAAVLARLQKEVSVSGDIVVVSAGGELGVHWAGGESEPVLLTGRAHRVYTGMVNGF